MRTLLIALCAAAAVAATVASVRADGGTTYFKIREVGLSADGNFAYITQDAGTPANPDGCARANMYAIERDRVGDQAFDAMVRQFNTAMLANKRVRVWLDGCSAPLNGGTQPLVQQFYVYRD